MVIPVWLLNNINSIPVKFFSPDHFNYHIGLQNTIDVGIKRFNKQLQDRGQILIGEPFMVDYLNYNDEIIYVILFKSLSKLEYLEYMYEKRVGKNHGSNTL